MGCDPDPAIKTHGQSLQELEEEEEEEEHNDAEYLGSYVIEIGSERREEIEEAINVDEAIAWVKEKSQSRKSEDFSIGYQQQNMVKWAHLETESSPEARQKIDEGRQVVFECLTQPKSDFEKTQFLMARVSQELKRRETSQETHQYDQDMEMRLIEEDIKRWSERKEGNIRSLLATLQYILWPESGWHAVPLTHMIEPSHVRKAYQKARLCLHPDKLQQKGATTPQKYLAERVFNILQEAWATFNSQDVFSG